MDVATRWLSAVVAIATGCTFQTTGYRWVDGKDRVVTAADSSREARLVVIDQAARDLSCPNAQLTATDSARLAYVVEGCGRRGVFVLVYVRAWGAGYEQAWWRALDISDPHEPPPTPRGPVSTDWPIDSQVSSTWNDAQRWIVLARQGAIDLACGRTAVTPDFVPQGPRTLDVPIVEGCGKRATYVAERGSDVIRLSSVVAIKRRDQTH
jgi:hypothetical protein